MCVSPYIFGGAPHPNFGLFHPIFYAPPHPPENRDEEPLAEIDARLRALQEYMERLGTR